MYRFQLLALAVMSLLWVEDLAGEGGSAKKEDSFSNQGATSDVVVTFVHAEWCSPCHQVDREILASVDGQALWKKLDGRRVDFDTPEGQAFTHAHRILSLPTILVAKDDGTELGRIEGFLPPAEYLEKLSALARGDSVVTASVEKDDSVADVLGKARKALMAGDETQGIALCRKVQTMDAENREGGYVDAARLLGRYWIRAMGQPAKGALELERALEVHPGHKGEAGTVFWLAKAYHEQGQHEKAITAFARYVQGNASARSYLVRAHFFYLHKKEPQQVRAGLEAAIELDENLSYAYFLLAELARDKGEIEKAKEWIDKAMEKEPNKAIFVDLKNEL